MIQIAAAAKLVWENRLAALCALCLALLLVVWGLMQHIGKLNATLAAKPKVEYSKQVVEKKVVVAGPERVVEKIREVPGGERIVERTIYRDVVRTETGTDTNVDRKEAPVGLPATRKSRYVGLGLDPLAPEKPRLRAGLTFWDRLDLGAAYDTRFAPKSGALQAEASFRF